MDGSWLTETIYYFGFESDLPPSLVDTKYECEKHVGKYYMFLFCFVLLDVFCLIDSLCYLEMTEKSKECAKMLNEVDWGISDDDDDEFRSDSGKE